MGKREASHDDPDPFDLPVPNQRHQAWIEEQKYAALNRGLALPAPKLPRPTRLEDIPPDVHYDDATITAWDGESFIDIEKWRVRFGCQRIDPNYIPPPPDAEESLTGICNHGIRVYLIRHPGRWQMYTQAPNQDTWTRRKDFATISQRHSQECAELWYGVPTGGWQQFTDDLPSPENQERMFDE
jgi:hypothetical protein